MGNAFKDDGNIKKAIQAYKKSLSIKPDLAEAYRHISSIYKYSTDDPEFSKVLSLLSDVNISDDVRCNLNFALAKMYEDSWTF